MGHACSANCSNYFAKLIPDTGVQYTGPAIASLGICTGDYLSEVDAVILQKLIDYSTGVGISIPSIDLTTCDAFAACITCCGTCTDLPCLLECYKNSICSIFDDLTELQADVAALLDGPYDTGCLTNLATNPTLNQIIQRLILQFCELSTAYNTLQTQVNGITANLSTNIGNFLGSAITSLQGPTVLNKTGTGATTQFNLLGFVPIGAIIMAGRNLNMADFDSTGLGNSGTSAYPFAICNGNNGTDNMSGLFPVGTGMGPAVITGAVLPFNTTGGAYAEVLTSAQIPASTVSGSLTVNDPGHGHPFHFIREAAAKGNGTQTMNPLSPTVDTTPWYDASTGTNVPYSGPHPPGTGANVGRAKTGITITGAGLNVSGGGQAHNNMPPYRALYFIQRVR